MASFSKLPGIVRRILVAGLKLGSAGGGGNPHTGDSRALLPPATSSMYIIGDLLESCGGAWTLDGKLNNDPLKVFVRSACGELRLCLSDALHIIESEEGAEKLLDLSKRISVFIQIFIYSTKHLTEIVDGYDDDDDGSCRGNRKEPVWSSLPFDVLLDLKGSLDDGANALMQFLAEGTTTNKVQSFGRSLQSSLISKMMMVTLLACISLSAR